MEYLVIENNGVADFNALRLIGFSSKKEEDDTIGQFGSGFKYALAQCFREDIKPIIMLGKEIIRTDVISDGNNQEIVYLKDTEVIRSSIHPNFGQYDWNELWFILREFICNAIDSNKGGIEGSHWKYKVMEVDDINQLVEDNKTKIIIPYSRFRFVNLENKFLTGSPKYSNSSGDAYFSRSPAIYKKRIFVRDSKTLFSYNFKHLKLTESRTCSPSAIDDALEYFLCWEKNPKYFEELFINHNNSDGSLIHEFKVNPFTLSEAAGQAFKNVYGDNVVMTSKDMPAHFNDRLKNMVTVDYLSASWRAKLSNLGIKDWVDVIGKVAARTTSKIVNFTDKYGIIKDINKKLFSDKPIPPINWFEDPDNSLKGLADSTGISFNINYYGDNVDFRMTVIEELIHYHHKVEDYTRSFQDIVLKMLVNRL